MALPPMLLVSTTSSTCMRSAVGVHSTAPVPSLSASRRRRVEVVFSGSRGSNNTCVQSGRRSTKRETAVGGTPTMSVSVVMMAVRKESTSATKVEALAAARAVSDRPTNNDSATRSGAGVDSGVPVGVPLGVFVTDTVALGVSVLVPVAVMDGVDVGVGVAERVTVVVAVPVVVGV